MVVDPGEKDGQGENRVAKNENYPPPPQRGREKGRETDRLALYRGMI